MRTGHLFLAGTIVFASATVHAQRRDESHASAASALADFNRGVDLYDRHDYTGALQAFRASYNAAPSPNSRLYIARCLRETGDLPNAIAEYRATFDTAAERARTESRYTPTRDAAQQEMAELQSRAGRVQVDASALPADAVVRIDGREFTRDALSQPVYVAPGHIAVSVDATGYRSYTTTVMTAAGEQSSVRPTLVAATGESHRETPVASTGRSITLDPTYRNIAIASAGVGILGFVGLIAFGAESNRIFSDVQDRCAPGPCGEAWRGTIATGQTYETLANVGLAVGIVGVLAGGAFLYWSYRKGTAHEVTVGSSGTSMFVGGRF